MRFRHASMMRILGLAREPGDKRTGTFTKRHRIAVGRLDHRAFFTGWKHGGENISHVLKQRARELPAPIQMCDALSHEERLRFHQEHSKPLMKGLQEWMEAQLAEHKRNRTPAWAKPSPIS